MQISSIVIKGFRSFGPEIMIPINEPLTTFIGHNSSGKTTALEALRKVFGISSEREVFKEDFHVADKEDSEKVNKKNLSIEIQFAFEKDDSNAIAHFFSDMVVDALGEEPYIRIRLESSWTESEIYQEGEIETKLYFITVPTGSLESEDSKRMFPNHLRQLIQVIYVPAIRKPSDQIKYASGSMLYRVLRRVKWDKKFKKDFEEKISGLEELFSGLDEFNVIQQSISGFWSQFHKDPRFKETALGFGQSDFESVLKRMEVSFSPTGVHRPFKVDELGEGYRSLFYLTLVCALLEVEEKLSNESDEIGITRPLLTLLAIEEPENHIAPQLLGRVTTILSRIAKAPNAQIFITSHTPAIIKRISPESICHFRITKKFETEVNTIILPPETDEAYKYVKEAIQNFPEIYFAKVVVIGEGDSEEVVINKMTEVLDINFDDNLISFAPLGHRFVHHIWKLLSGLKIPYVTILDLDLERYGGGWGRIAYALVQLLKVGFPENEVLATKNGTLSLEKLKAMKDRPVDSKSMPGWLGRLEDYGVYFSSPLDIDFLMLEHYSSFYKAAIPKNGGPEIPNVKEEPVEYANRVTAAVHAALKSEKATAATYTKEQKELMIWYQYHFLGRGKPVTHILALSKMSKNDFKDNIPPVLNKLFIEIKKLSKR